MGDPGGQFLEGGIGHQPQRRLVRLHRCVAALLGDPAVRPGPQARSRPRLASSWWWW
jgi:hypothetical protein